jgi:hypothetical protein
LPGQSAAVKALLRGAPSSASETVSQIGITHQTRKAIGQKLRRPRLMSQTVGAFGHKLRDSSGSTGDHRLAKRHALEDYAT